MSTYYLDRLRQRSRLFEYIQDHRFNVLLGLLVILYLSLPVIQMLFPGAHQNAARIVIAFLFAALLLAAILAISKSPTVTRIALCLAVPFLVLDVAVIFNDSNVVQIFQHSINIVFLAFTSMVILGYVFSAQRITFNTISASLCVYFLMGLFWAVVFSLLSVVQPESFNIGFESDTSRAGPMLFGSGDSIYPLYFSLVTLTTLGYGDITPATSIARSLAAFEAVMGQLYLAVLVARLVGLHTSQSFRKRFGCEEES